MVQVEELVSLGMGEMAARRLCEEMEDVSGIRMVERLLASASAEMGHGRAFGVEGLVPDGEMRSIALYVNVGDPYRPTLLWDVKLGEFCVCCWGDVLEEWQNERDEEDAAWADAVKDDDEEDEA